jgi:hypothetical protein
MAETPNKATSSKATDTPDVVPGNVGKPATPTNSKTPEAIPQNNAETETDNAPFVAPNPMRNTAVVELSQGVVPNADGDELLAAAQRRAPHLTTDFLDKYDLDDDFLRAVAGGQEPPPPYIPDVPGAQELHRTPGGWQITAPGQSAKDANSNAITRY